MTPALADRGKNISAVVALEIPSLAPNKTKLSFAGSLGIIKNAVVNNYNNYVLEKETQKR